MTMFSREFVRIEKLEVWCIIGITPRERETSQPLEITLEWPWDFGMAVQDETIAATINYSEVAQSIRDFLACHAPQLLETLARQLVLHLSAKFPFSGLSLRIRKPQAVAGSSGPEVSLCWQRDD